MHRIFLPSDRFQGKSARITDSAFAHLIRVLRLDVGAELILINTDSGAWLARIATVDKREAIADLIQRADDLLAPEPVIRLIVAQALGKGDKFETVLQHGVEVGATEFVPVIAERCVAEMPRDPGKAVERLKRWNQITLNAAEQSGRSVAPSVHAPLKVAKLAELYGARAGVLPLLLQPDKELPTLKSCLGQKPPNGAPGSIVVAIGPEGGWSPAEREIFILAGWQAVSLGHRVLRTETAALAALAQISYEFES